MITRFLTAAVAATCALTSAVAEPAHAADPRLDHPRVDQTRLDHTTPEPARLSAAQRKVLIDATKRFTDVDEAIATGYLPTELCTPGMGWHYLNPKLAAAPAIDPVWPEVLLYVPGPKNSIRLAGIEYFKADADGNLTTDPDRPTLFGHPFDGPMTGHEVPAGAPPMPVHYDLHVWLYLTNPAGQLAPDNPRITCP
ncbi:hypothetical protein [Actinoplanes sp. CA-252034]|uniref:hypothetical protein n=1 Tax=Actinoplanes sp. CA-252034 TaxID=3239906 RepID=UPI003D97FC73